MNLKDFMTYFESLQAELNRPHQFEPGDRLIKQNIQNADIANLAYYVTHTISDNTDWLGNYLSCNVANCTEMFHSFQLDFGKLLSGTETADTSEPFKQKGLLLGLDQIYNLLKEHLERSSSAARSGSLDAPATMPISAPVTTNISPDITANTDRLIETLTDFQSSVINLIPGDPQDLTTVESHLSSLSKDHTQLVQNTQSLPQIPALITEQSLQISHTLNTLTTHAGELSDTSHDLQAQMHVLAEQSANHTALSQSMAANLTNLAINTANLTENSAHILEAGSCLTETTHNIAENLIALTTNSALYTRSSQNIEASVQTISEASIQIAENTQKLESTLAKLASAERQTAPSVAGMPAQSTAPAPLTASELRLDTTAITDSLEKLSENIAASTARLEKSAQAAPQTALEDTLNKLSENIAASTARLTAHTEQITDAVLKIAENNAFLSQNVDKLSQKCDRMIRILELLVVSTNQLQHAHANEAPSRLQNAVNDLRKDS